MADPVAAHIESVSVKSTDVAVIAADRLDGLSDASYSRSSDIVEKNYLGGGAYKKRMQTLKDTSASLSGHFVSEDAPQNLLRTSYGTGATVYVTFIFDSIVATGVKTGERVPMLVESYEEKHTSGGIIEFSCSLQGNGTPTDILAA